MSLLVTVVGPRYTPTLIHFIQHSQQRLSLQTGWAEMSLFAIINNLIFDVQYSPPHIFFSPLLCLFSSSVCVCVRVIRCWCSRRGYMRQREHLSACIREMTMKKTRRLLSKHSDSDTDTCVGCLPPYLIFFLGGGLFFFFFFRFIKRGPWKTYSKDEFAVITCKTTYLLRCLIFHFLF